MEFEQAWCIQANEVALVKWPSSSMKKKLPDLETLDSRDSVLESGS